MNNSAALLCAIRGPILLIALGVLMVVDQSGSLNFSKTWPVLVIVFGLLKLAERAFVRQQLAGVPPFAAEGYGPAPFVPPTSPQPSSAALSDLPPANIPPVDPPHSGGAL